MYSTFTEHPPTIVSEVDHLKLSIPTKLAVGLLGLVLLAVPAINAFAQSCPEPSFHAARNIDSGLDEPLAIAVADFNNDGNSDLVTGGSGPPNFRGLNISVLIGNGKGSFEQPLVLFTHPVLLGHPTGFAVGDFDGDGNDDIVVSEGALRFFYGDGAGQFRGPVEYLIPGEPERVYAGDLNNDGKTDLVNFVSATFPFVTILIGNSAGGFDQIPGPPLTFADRLALADFNGDGKMDLLAANRSTIQVGLGDGAGHFAPQPTIGINFTVASVPQVADFNLDGRLDVIITGGIADFTVFFPGDGLGGFGSPISAQSNMEVQATADFNGDGKPDLAGLERLAGVSGVFRIGVGDGAGHFTESPRRGIGGVSFGMVAGDFNNDGKSDLASINPRADDVSIVFGDGAGGFDAAEFYILGNSSQVLAAAAGDFNGDGKVDFAATELTNRRIIFFNGNGAGSFVQGRVVSDGFSYTYLTTGDFNHDGIMDLVCVSTADNLFIVVFGGLDDVRTRAFGIPGANSVTTGDFNGDGHLDIAASALNSVGIVLGNGAGEFSPIQTINLGTKPTGIAVADFNGDAKSDLAIANQQPNTVLILLGDGAGNFNAGSSVDLSSGIFQPRFIVAADFNLDSKADLAIANRDGGNVFVVFGDGTGNFGTAATYSVGGAPLQIVATDFNLDGLIDLAVVNALEISNISILMNDGAGGFLKRLNYGVGRDPRQIGLGDFNSDGKSDLVVANSLGSSAEVLLSAPCRLPDLAIGKSHDGNFAVGVPGNYRLKVTNVGLSRTADTTVLTDILPPGLSFISAVGQGWQCSAVGQTLTCTHGARLEAGESTVVSLAVSPGAGALPGVINTAGVSGSLDANSANNTSSDTTVVNLGVSISGRVTDESGNGLSGTTIVLGGAVNRTTTTDATGNYLFNGLPEGLSYTVTPSKNVRVFVPVNRVFKNLRGGGSGSFTSRSQMNGKIVFTRNLPGRLNIWTMNADGTGQVQLTNAPEFDTNATWSPDGKKIAFQRGSSPNAGVFVMDADGGNLRRVTPGDGESPVWSPDGQKIAFSKTFSAFPGIYTININGSNEKRILPFGGFLSPLSWSPDGSRIAFTREPPTVIFGVTGFHLYTMDVTGTSQTLIVNNNDRTDFEPDFSPDGLKLLYLVFQDSQSIEMAVANADGSGQVLLGQVSSIANPSWSPDGAKIVFTDQNDIWTASPDGSGRTNLTNSGFNEKDPDWQPIVTTTGPNQIDDAEFFVLQHYLDFLNRPADPAGLAFWKNQITMCGNDPQCLEIKRTNVSAAFFLSIEFEQTGYLVERIYKAAYGDANGSSTLGGTHQLPVPIIRLNEFSPDAQRIGQGVIVGQLGWEAVLENNKQAFLLEFVQRSRFMAAYPASMTSIQFVNALNNNSGNPLSVVERDQLVADLDSGARTRAQVLRAVAEDQNLNVSEFNRAFVLMQYFGYLLRNPNDPQDSDYTGYDFWLRKLNQFNGNFVSAEMVKAFITSAEYRQRFGP